MGRSKADKATAVQGLQSISVQRRNVLRVGSVLAASAVCPKVADGATALTNLEPATALPKPPSQYTKQANKRALDELPFQDHSDFQNAQRGFIANLPGDVIRAPDGSPAFNLATVRVPTSGPAPETMNPSLWRVSQLNSFAGLFKVTDRLYQVRNIDVTNITFVEGERGVIVIDPAISPMAARNAMELYFSYRPKKPVTAVIYTHSHLDHFGGVGSVTSVADVAAGRTRIIGPAGFTEEAVSENLYAGNAMLRRAMYMGGGEMPRGTGPEQTLGSALGISGITDPPTLIPPTELVTKTGQKMTIDGVEFEFLMAPGSEAPSEMHFYIRSLKALCTAENAVHTLHNLYTLRGAKTRDSLKWVGYLNETLDMWGDEAEVLYAPHQWPTWGNAEIRSHIENYRDAFKFIHDRSLHLANAGYTMPEIGDLVKLPPALEKNWATRGYYGTVSHNARAVYNFYLGYFSANPAELHPLPPVQSASRYVEAMGGAREVMVKAQSVSNAGDYRWAAQLLNHVVLADPANQSARFALADVYEQLGYQSEAATWRNFYFAGALELRSGTPKDEPGMGSSPDMVKNIPLDMFIDYLAIQMDSTKAEGKTITVNFTVTDTQQRLGMRLHNQVLNHFGRLAPVPDVTIVGDNSSIVTALMSGSIDDAVASGKIKIDGRSQALAEVLALVSPPQLWFPIVTRPKWLA